jgi:hypothetical protein
MENKSDHPTAPPVEQSEDDAEARYRDALTEILTLRSRHAKDCHIIAREALRKRPIEIAVDAANIAYLDRIMEGSRKPTAPPATELCECGHDKKSHMWRIDHKRNNPDPQWCHDCDCKEYEVKANG